MKGFIEVTKKRDNGQEAKEYMNTAHIVSLGFDCLGNVVIDFGQSFMRVSETYEEIKQKIKEAQEQNNGNDFERIKRRSRENII